MKTLKVLPIAIKGYDVTYGPDSDVYLTFVDGLTDDIEHEIHHCRYIASIAPSALFSDSINKITSKGHYLFEEKRLKPNPETYTITKITWVPDTSLNEIKNFFADPTPIKIGNERGEGK